MIFYFAMGKFGDQNNEPRFYFGHFLVIFYILNPAGSPKIYIDGTKPRLKSKSTSKLSLDMLWEMWQDLEIILSIFMQKNTFFFIKAWLGPKRLSAWNIHI